MIGKVLVLTEIPPEETKWHGMKALTCHIKGNVSKVFKVLVTNEDIDNAVYTYCKTGSFTFEKDKDNDEYAVIAEVKG